MFSFFSRLQVVGRFLESLIPLPVGPRHCGQFSLAAARCCTTPSDAMKTKTIKGHVRGTVTGNSFRRKADRSAITGASSRINRAIASLFRPNRSARHPPQAHLV